MEIETRHAVCKLPVADHDRIAIIADARRISVALYRYTHLRSVDIMAGCAAHGGIATENTPPHTVIIRIPKQLRITIIHVCAVQEQIRAFCKFEVAILSKYVCVCMALLAESEFSLLRRLACSTGYIQSGIEPIAVFIAVHDRIGALLYLVSSMFMINVDKS